MIPKEHGAKQESSSSTSWSRLKDPRIVRVSRAMGGKDRHSKVCTVRGLRDRRVRLSVPTAIQLYDLQERLGLNQPSKVVDWLLDAARDEIDELPPLQIPQGMLNPSKQALEERHVVTTRRRGEEESHDFHLQNPPPFTTLMSTRWDPSISLGLAAHQHQDFASHQHQLLVYQSGMITQPYFVPQNPSFDSPDMSSPSDIVRPFDFNMNSSVDEQNNRQS